MNHLTPQQQLDLYYLARNVQWRYRLDQYEGEVLKGLLASVDRATIAAGKKLAKGGAGQFTAEKIAELTLTLDGLTASIREQVGQDTAEASAQAGAYALKEHYDILSVGGAAKGILGATVGAGQLRSMMGTTNIGGDLLAGWVDSAFDAGVKTTLLDATRAGMISGEGYSTIVANIMREGLDITRRDVVTLVRTYVQTANVAAMEATYERNAEFISVLRWSSVTENGNMQTGRGTCLRCAALDGERYSMTEKRPPCPLHPRCRCCYLPVISWQSLGLSMEKLDEAARPWTVREDKSIDAGGRRTIEEVGLHRGSYGEWLGERSPALQKEVLGPGRYELISSGAIGFGDLVDRKTGVLRTLKELGGKSHE